MKLKREFAGRCLVTCVFLFILLISCSQDLYGTRVPFPLSTASIEDLGGQSPDELTTLSSLEKLQDYPLYVMHFAGGYDYPRLGSSVQPMEGLACSLFAAMGDPGGMMYGRNFDWDYSPVLLLFTDPPDGYASVSMVNLSFLGIDVEESPLLLDIPIKERKGLLTAPSMPFDGMNEYGLTIGMAAVPGDYVGDASNDPSRPTIGSIGIIRQILDHARNVDEALELFSQYNVDFSGGPLIHYLVADPNGKAVLVEFYQSEMIQLPNGSPWHMATNHIRNISEGDGGCPRYRVLSDRLTASNGRLDAGGAMQLLSQVAQSSTQWSSVYNMSTGDISLAIAQDYDKIFTFHLDLVRP